MAEQGRARGRVDVWRPWSAARPPTFSRPNWLEGLAQKGVQRLEIWVQTDIGAGRLVPWLAISYGLGIVFYFTADREPVNFDLWRYLRPIYEAVPAEPTRLDLVIMKSSQGGATILGLLWSLWLTLRAHCRVGYFLPTADAALKLSADRYIRLVRENPEMHRLMGDPDAPQASRVIDEGSAATDDVATSDRP